MPRPIVESDNFASEILVPTGGDPRTAGSVEAPFQALANRTLNLKNTVDALGGREGVTKFREVANLDELKAIGRADRKNGDLVLVPTYGIYRYSDAYPRTDFAFWRVNSNEPSADNPSYGQWRHTLQSAIAGEFGILIGGPDGRILGQTSTNGIVHLGNDYKNVTPDELYDSSKWHDSSVVANLPNTVAANDIIDARITWTVLTPDAGSWVLSLKTFATGNPIYTDFDETNRSVLTVGKQVLSGRVTVPHLANVTARQVVLRVTGSAGINVKVAGQTWLSTTVYRP